MTDNITGLMWQQADDDVKRVWEDAITYCEDFTLADHTDWRLPNYKELRSIVDYNQFNPAIDETYFLNIKPFSRSYWTSTTAANETDSAWSVDFEDGDTDRTFKLPWSTLYVRCVRGG